MIVAPQAQPAPLAPAGAASGYGFRIAEYDAGNGAGGRDVVCLEASSPWVCQRKGGVLIVRDATHFR